jgi:hypothetical protein
MRQAALLLILLLALQPALAAERGPVCREPSVVDEIALEVGAENYYGNIDPRLVTERPTADPLVVRCDVCVLSAPYDTIRFGDRPIAHCVYRGFAVKILTGGFVVHAER